jgi:hypothetical protein
MAASQIGAHISPNTSWESKVEHPRAVGHPLRRLPADRASHPDRSDSWRARAARSNFMTSP